MIDNAFLRRRASKRIHEIARRQLGIQDVEFPIVIFNESEIPKGMKRSFKGRENWTGACSSEVPLMFINLPLIKDDEELENTIQHELVHYRFGYSKHGVEFDKNLYAIKRGVLFDKVKMHWRIDSDGYVGYYFVIDKSKGIGRGKWNLKSGRREKEEEEENEDHS